MMLMLVDEIWSNIFLRLPSVPLWSVPLPQRSVYPCSLALWWLQGDNHHFIIQWNESTIQTTLDWSLFHLLTSNLCRTARMGLMRKTAPRSRVLTTSSTVHRWQLFVCFCRMPRQQVFIGGKFKLKTFDAEILTLSKLSSECSMWLFQLPKCSFKRFARIKQAAASSRCKSTISLKFHNCSVFDQKSIYLQNCKIEIGVGNWSPADDFNVKTIKKALIVRNWFLFQFKILWNSLKI